MSFTPLRYQHQEETRQGLLEVIENFPGWVEDQTAQLQTAEKYTYVVLPQSAYLTTRVEGELFDKDLYATNKLSRKGPTVLSEEPNIPEPPAALSDEATPSDKEKYIDSKERFRYDLEYYKLALASESKKGLTSEIRRICDGNNTTKPRKTSLASHQRC
jgi:hypothetical protein